MKAIVTVIVLAALPAMLAFGAPKKNEEIEKHCTTCHSSAIIYNKKYDEKRWDATVERMKKHGLKLSAEDEKEVKDFLYTLK